MTTNDDKPYVQQRCSAALRGPLLIRSTPLVYRPNSRSISQPSNPAAASGRADVRVGAGLPAALAGKGALIVGELACEAACARFEKKPPACEPGNAATATP
jgi:hypothetical protein